MTSMDLGGWGSKSATKIQSLLISRKTRSNILESRAITRSVTVFCGFQIWKKKKWFIMNELMLPCNLSFFSLNFGWKWLVRNQLVRVLWKEYYLIEKLKSFVLIVFLISHSWFSEYCGFSHSKSCLIKNNTYYFFKRIMCLDYNFTESSACDFFELYLLFLFLGLLSLLGFPR